MKKFDLKKIKNDWVIRLRILWWRLSGTSRHAKYEEIQNKFSVHTREHEINQETIRQTFEFIQSYISDKSIKILDAGCGDGWTLDQFRLRGYSDLVGVDLNESKLETARVHGHRVFKTILPELPFVDKQFDLIYCRDVYEHLLFPDKTLESFNRVLKPGAILFLGTAKTGVGLDWNESHTVVIRGMKDVTRMLRRKGFEVIQEQVHFSDEEAYWFVAKKK